MVLRAECSGGGRASFCLKERKIAMVDLKAKPYCLPDEDVRWVEETIAGMTPEEKVGQLFFQLTASQDENYLRELMEKYHLGGCRYNPMPGAAVQQQNRTLQKYAKVPVFIACNTEAGGDGACADGTNIGSGIKIGATRNNDYAYALGKMANEEAAAIGCNMAFAPVCDIHYNWENTEIVTRAFGNDPVRVAQMSKAYMDGLHTIPGFACTAKHFPGNGLDFRDAHLSNNVNTFSVEEWDKTYGMVYKTLIDGGLDAIMGGHIMLPEYARAINPALKDEDMMPATLSPEIMTTLLRGKLGFNGMVVTDASHMVGMTDRMTRREMLPASINAGCDMFLQRPGRGLQYHAGCIQKRRHQRGPHDGSAHAYPGPESASGPEQKSEGSACACARSAGRGAGQRGIQGDAQGHQPGLHHTGKIQGQGCAAHHTGAL